MAEFESVGFVNARNFIVLYLLVLSVSLTLIYFGFHIPGLLEYFIPAYGFITITLVSLHYRPAPSVYAYIGIALFILCVVLIGSYPPSTWF